MPVDKQSIVRAEKTIGILKPSTQLSSSDLGQKFCPGNLAREVEGADWGCLEEKTGEADVEAFTSFNVKWKGRG